MVQSILLSDLRLETDKVLNYQDYLPLTVHQNHHHQNPDINQNLMLVNDHHQLRIQQENPSTNWVTNSNDCNDSRSDVHPGAEELCDRRGQQL